MTKGFIWKAWVVWEVIQFGVTGIEPGQEQIQGHKTFAVEADKSLKTILFYPQFYIWNCLTNDTTNININYLSLLVLKYSNPQKVSKNGAMNTYIPFT